MKCEKFNVLIVYLNVIPSRVPATVVIVGSTCGGIGFLVIVASLLFVAKKKMNGGNDTLRKAENNDKKGIQT